MDHIALIPSFEPDNVLAGLAEKLKAAGFSIVIVDDGSGPAYQDIFHKLQKYAEVVSYSQNHGKGYALKTGLKLIRSLYPDAIVVTLDADGQHAVEDAVRICLEAEKDRRTFVIGSRKLPEDAPIKSRLGNGITRKIFRLVTGTTVYDTQSGLRAFWTDRIPELLKIDGNRYDYEMNVLLYLASRRLPVREIPIEVIYFDKTNSVSHFHAWKDSVRIYGKIFGYIGRSLAEFFKFTGSSLGSFLVDYSLYSLLTWMFGTGQAALLAANFGARAVSSVFNFILNKKLVFGTKGNLKEETIRYFGLVLFNICINSIILTILTRLGCNAYGAKLIVELIMFLFSYLIQHCFIFRKEKTE